MLSIKKTIIYLIITNLCTTEIMPASQAVECYRQGQSSIRKQTITQYVKDFEHLDEGLILLKCENETISRLYDMLDRTLPNEISTNLIEYKNELIDNEFIDTEIFNFTNAFGQVISDAHDLIANEMQKILLQGIKDPESTISCTWVQEENIKHKHCTYILEPNKNKHFAYMLKHAGGFMWSMIRLWIQTSEYNDGLIFHHVIYTDTENALQEPGSLFYDRTREIIEILIAAQISIHKKDSTGETPLFAAIRRDRCDIVKILINAGAKVSEPNRSREFPLKFAISHRYVTITRMLLDAGACLDRTASLNHNTLLRIAIELGSNNIIRFLIDREPDLVSHLNENGETVLHVAVQSNSSQCFLNYTETIRSLSSNNPQIINIQNIHGDTALHFATIKHGYNYKYLAIMEILLNEGADPNIATFHPALRINGWGAQETPLHSAAKNNDASGIFLLIKYGADLECKNAHEHTPLYLAVQKNNIHAANILIRRGADITMLYDYKPLIAMSHHMNDLFASVQIKRNGHMTFYMKKIGIL